MEDEQFSSTVVALLDQRLGVIERKLDKVVDDHERRLRKLEAWMYAVPASLLAAVSAVIVAVANR
jgi:hypothetical protein